MLGGQAIYFPVANFLRCICAKNYGNWLAVDKVIVKITRLTLCGPPCIIYGKVDEANYRRFGRGAIRPRFARRFRIQSLTAWQGTLWQLFIYS